MTNKKQRTSNIELLRIIAACGVVILHYNNSSIGGGFAYVQQGSINQYVLYILESVFICAVNLFVMVSAYFLCMTNKRKLIKVVELIMQVILFKFAFWAVSIVIGHYTFNVKDLILVLLPVNYYVILYVVLYIISPYINLVFQRLEKKHFRKLIIICMLLFSVWSIVVDMMENGTGSTFMGLSPIGLYGSGHGYSIVNFVLVYLIGSYIRLNGTEKKTSVLIMTGAACIGIMVVWKIVEDNMNISIATGWYYNNPFVIVLAAVVLCLFCRINIQSSCINELARGAFTCYLFHNYFMAHLGIKQAVYSNCMVMLLHIVVVSVGFYIISYIVYKVYTICTGWFFKRISAVVNKINISVTE